MGLIGWWRGENNGNDIAGTNNAYGMPNVYFTNGIVGQAFAVETLGPYAGVQIADQPYYALTNSLSIEELDSATRSRLLHLLPGRQPPRFGPLFHEHGTQ